MSVTDTRHFTKSRWWSTTSGGGGGVCGGSSSVLSADPFGCSVWLFLHLLHLDSPVERKSRGDGRQRTYSQVKMSQLTKRPNCSIRTISLCPSQNESINKKRPNCSIILIPSEFRKMDIQRKRNIICQPWL